jgi:hypothetical protein
MLEERRLLSSFLWTGAVSDSWRDPKNWVSLDNDPDKSGYPRSDKDVANFDPANRAGKNADAALRSGDLTLGSVFIAASYTGTITLWTGDLAITNRYLQAGGTLAGWGNLIVGTPRTVAIAEIDGPAKFVGKGVSNGKVDVLDGSYLTIRAGASNQVTFDHYNVQVETGGNLVLTGIRSPFNENSTINLANAQVLNQGSMKTIGDVTIEAEDTDPRGVGSKVAIDSGATLEATAANVHAAVRMSVRFDTYGTVHHRTPV